MALSIDAVDTARKTCNSLYSPDTALSINADCVDHIPPYQAVHLVFASRLWMLDRSHPFELVIEQHLDQGTDRIKGWVVLAFKSRIPWHAKRNQLKAGGTGDVVGETGQFSWSNCIA